MSKRSQVKSVITVTDSAVNRIKYLLNKKQDPNIIGIHLSTKLRGCNGNSYVMNYTKKNYQQMNMFTVKGLMFI